MFRIPTFLLLTAAVAACDAPLIEEAIIVEPVLEEPASLLADAPPPPPPAQFKGTPRRGVITAGDIDDTLNLAAFQRYQARTANTLQLPKTNLSRPVLAQILGPNGTPAPGAYLTLRKPGAQEPFYRGYAGVDGMVTVFPAALGHGQPRQVEISVFGEDQAGPKRQVIDTGKRTMVRLHAPHNWAPDFFDLAFVVDTTGSMSDELAWLTQELKAIARQARLAAPKASIRYALIVYRDHGDDYVVRNYGFTGSLSRMRGWLRAQSANGGGDYPEAAAEALTAGAQLNWKRGRGERLMVHIADAPAHAAKSQAYLRAAAEAAAKDVQVYTLAASGVAEEAEFLMRQASVVSGGRYLFLTDDSGVGLAHGEPAIACYRVTALTDLMKRVLVSELTGRRVEARQRDVVRTVGAYRNGRCLGSS